MADERAVMAARNNADWYELMFEAHGLRYDRTPGAFVALDQPPPYYSWMTLQDPGPGPEVVEIIRREAERPTFGIKDSFHVLDLPSLGLAELFSASWMWADNPAAGADTTGWRRIADDAALVAWEAAWSERSPGAERLFPPALLHRSDVALWGREADDGFDGGAVANRSSDCVGMSNVFGPGAVPAAARLCAAFGAGLPVVGYEWGDALATALRTGFEPTGPLRVCVKQEGGDV